LAKKLIELSPEGLRYVAFANSGAEAVEVAIKLVRSKTNRLSKHMINMLLNFIERNTL
jgi:acetylornithine/succinyldiaminopimelate/putrescine aminotransferase